MLLGFKERFVEPIQNGTKIFTLRKPRKKMPKVGETLYMYTGLRTKHCYKISDTETLKSIQEAYLFIKKTAESLIISIEIDSIRLTEAQINQFAVYDGFENKNEWADYWLKTSGAIGNVKLACGRMDLIHWTDLKY